jgi:hypothetical protein
MDPVEQGELELQRVVVSEFSGGSPLIFIQLEGRIIDCNTNSTDQVKENPYYSRIVRIPQGALIQICNSMDSSIILDGIYMLAFLSE